MFPLNPSKNITLALNMFFKDDSTLWHHRYGHVNYDTLVNMSQKEIVTRLPKVYRIDQICEGCALGKHARKSFPKKAKWRASKALELIHSDICGPMRMQTIGDCKYFTTFIDNFSRKCLIFFLKEKSQAIHFFFKYLRPE